MGSDVMMKMMILAPRRAGMSPDEFRAYVTDVHGPLVRSVTEVASEIRHYHYNFPVAGAVDSAFGHALADLDIITQGYFDSREAQLANMKHPRFKEVLRPDEKNFADTDRALMHYTDEHEVLATASAGPVTSPYRLFHLRRRAEGLSRAEFQRRWGEDVPAAMVPTLEQAGVARYVQNQVQAEEHHPDGQNHRFYDVIDEMWLPSLAVLGNLAERGAAEQMRTAEAGLLAPGRTLAFVAEVVVNIP